MARGGYVLVEAPGTPDVVLIGTGSEVRAVRGRRPSARPDRRRCRPVHARVVSLPSWDLFGLQNAEYRREVLGSGLPRLAVEAAASFGWDRYADDVVAIDHFGASAPGAEVLEHFGYTPDNVAAGTPPPRRHRRQPR